jgi:hypothetical protein
MPRTRTGGFGTAPRWLFALWLLALVPLGSSIAMADDAAEDPALVPASACAGGDDWIDWSGEVVVRVNDALQRAVAQHGRGVGNQVGPVWRQFAADLRAKPAPPALVGYQVFLAWTAEQLATPWEAASTGNWSPYDREPEERIYGYVNAVFASYATICDTRYKVRTWAYGDGTVAPAPTPMPAHTEPVLRADVCDRVWAEAYQRRVLAAVALIKTAERTGDPARIAAAYRAASIFERFSAPPAAAVPLSVFFVFAWDEYARSSEHPDRPAPLPDRYDDGDQAVADLTALFDAYNAICATDLLQPVWTASSS